MATWDIDSVRQILQEKIWYGSEREIKNAVQFILTDETKVNCFHTGRVVVQGKDTEIKEEATQLFSPSSGPSEAATARGAVTSSQTTTPRRVFIVYGHDLQAREQLELLLRRLRLEPIVLQNIPGGGDTIIEKLEVLTAADYACVLVTPDDEGRARSDTSDLRPRARQNVVLELGMVLSRLGRSRVAVLVKGDEIERPSDIDGLLYIPFSNHIDEAKNLLAANLKEAGFSIEVDDLLLLTGQKR